MTLTHSGASDLSQLLEGTTAGALIPEIVRRGLQDLHEVEVSATIRETFERSTECSRLQV